jgi:hypothetical protein
MLFFMYKAHKLKKNIRDRFLQTFAEIFAVGNFFLHLLL